ncbi:MAG: helix-turn-helix domain-containing protein [Lachnospiraceae bacterium]|jgi:DNA binding domain, excisionase family|nr:helix-turn-helix domain-containing protein [Lachnospiraceae bacterium]
MKEAPRVEIKDKILLTVEEAAAYSNIGQNKIEEMSRKPNCPFVLYIGRRRLIKRREFEKYLEKVIEL